MSGQATRGIALNHEAATWIAPLFSASAVTAQCRPTLVDEELFPEELACLGRAVRKRRAEFGSVRVCARHALATMGIAPGSLAPLPDRSPRWPEGVVGSMTHTTDYCAVVVARASDVRSVGIDAEADLELEPALLPLVCTRHEQLSLSQRPNGARDALVYFAAKEAFYKCQYPLTRTFLDFQAVELDVDFARGTYQARVIKPAGHKPAWIDHTEGRFLRRDGLVLCGSQLRFDPGAVPRADTDHHPGGHEA
jgi:4'-phosphopantetheinyl transferase EntD